MTSSTSLARAPTFRASPEHQVLPLPAPLGSNSLERRRVRYVGHFGVSAVGAELERLSALGQAPVRAQAYLARPIHSGTQLHDWKYGRYFASICCDTCTASPCAVTG